MKQNNVPEIISIPLDTVVLKLKALFVKNIANFPFLDPPKL